MCMMLTNREIYHNKALCDMTDFIANLVIYVIMTFTPLVWCGFDHSNTLVIIG